MERQVDVGRRRARRRHRHREHRVGAQLGLRLGAVERDHRAVDGHLLGHVEPDELRLDELHHAVHRLAHALPEVALGVAVPQLVGLVLAGRRAARHRGAAVRAVLEDDIGLDGRIAARVKDLTGLDGDDDGHVGEGGRRREAGRDDPGNLSGRRGPVRR
jgi:hypothetical protein